MTPHEWRNLLREYFYGNFPRPDLVPNIRRQHIMHLTSDKIGWSVRPNAKYHMLQFQRARPINPIFK